MANFREQNFRNLIPITEKQIQEAHKDIDTWEAVKLLFKTSGWELLIKHIRDVHDKLDSVANCDDNYNTFLKQKGEVAGLRRLLHVSQTLQQKATAASRLLESALAQKEE